eukprot:gene21515-8248_t
MDLTAHIMSSISQDLRSRGVGISPSGKRHAMSKMMHESSGTVRRKSLKKMKHSSSGAFPGRKMPVSALPRKAKRTGFPAGKTGSLLRKGNYAKRVGAASGVYLAAVLEYVTAELLYLAGNTAKENKKNRITPRGLQ